MAEGILSFPFRLDTQGAAAVTGYGTDREVDEALAALSLTIIGERPLSMGFGVPDPAFHGFHEGDLQVGVDEYGPEGVTIENVDQQPISDTESIASIEWSRDDDPQEEM